MAIQRVQVPISFQFSETVYTASSSGGSTTQATTVITPPPVNTAVTIVDANTNNPATLFTGPTGGTTVTSPATDAGGNVNGWLVEGYYKFTAAAGGGYGGATIYWNAVRGDGVENIFPGAVGTAAIANNAITSPLLAAAIAQALVPTGVMLEFGGTSAPAGFLMCDGSVVSTTTYANLFAVIGTAFNTGSEGAGNFRLPKFNGRFALGKTASGAGSVLGGTGGTLGHTHHVEQFTVAPLDIGSIATAVVVAAHQHALTSAAAAVSILESPDGRAVEQHYSDPHPTITHNFSTKHLVDTVDRPLRISTTETQPASQVVGSTDSAGGQTITASSTAATGIVGSLSGGHGGGGPGPWPVPAHDTDANDPPYLVVNKIIKI